MEENFVMPLILVVGTWFVNQILTLPKVNSRLGEYQKQLDHLQKEIDQARSEADLLDRKMSITKEDCQRSLTALQVQVASIEKLTSVLYENRNCT